MNSAMNEALLSKMETDMNLFRFCNENQTKYVSRVLYSGMAMWMKAIALDGFQENSNQPTSVSKKHHTERSSFILKQFLDFAPEARAWFYDDNSLDKPLLPIQIMQERLLLSGELAELGFTNRIVSVLPTKNYISDNLVRYKGLHNDIHTQYNGVTSAIEEESIFENDKLSIDTLNFVEKYLHSANFKTDTWNAEKEYFNPCIRTDTFYQSWQKRPPEQEFYVSRIETGIQQYLYFIESSKFCITKSFKIDDYIYRNGNLSRILLAFRYKVDNPITVKIMHFPDHFELTRYIKSFPYPEEATLQAIGWPQNSISDNLNFCYHSYMLPEIKKILKNLLVKINEVTYERSI